MYTSMCEDLIQASVRARKIAKVGAADNREFSVDVTQPQSSAKKKEKSKTRHKEIIIATNDCT